jgi:hypothetical protein
MLDHPVLNRAAFIPTRAGNATGTRPQLREADWNVWLDPFGDLKQTLRKRLTRLQVDARRTYETALRDWHDWLSLP